MYHPGHLLSQLLRIYPHKYGVVWASMFKQGKELNGFIHMLLALNPGFCKLSAFKVPPQLICQETSLLCRSLWGAYQFTWCTNDWLWLCLNEAWTLHYTECLTLYISEDLKQGPRDFIYE